VEQSTSYPLLVKGVPHTGQQEFASARSDQCSPE